MQWLLTGTWPDNVSDHDAESDSDKCGEANAFNQGRLSFDEIENELSNISRATGNLLRANLLSFYTI